ncbi:MAG: hypothetical protein AAFY20_08735 [Cyanobacteria bacterium J06639_14]
MSCQTQDRLPQDLLSAIATYFEAKQFSNIHYTLEAESKVWAEYEDN